VSFSTLNLFSEPQIGVDIWPYEGGYYSISGGQVLSATLSKDLAGGGRGTITLAPGGPNGLGVPSWSLIITLQSLVVVAMSRGSHSNVVFVGVVVAVGEQQEWEAGQRVVRSVEVQVEDWSQWFRDRNWSSLTYLGVTNGALQAQIAGLAQPDAGISAQVFGGSLSVNPGLVAYKWYSEFMGGASGVLGLTNLQYGSNTVSWTAATTSHFEQYPFNTIFPFSIYYVSDEGSWWGKFERILEPPFYEMIVGSAPDGLWFGQAGAPSVQAQGNSGTLFQSSTMPNAVPARAQIVGRLNPLPNLTLGGSTQTSSGLSGQQAQVFGNADLSLWQTLPTFTPDGGPTAFISSRVQNTITDYSNFFVLNPVNYRNQFGQPNVPGIFMFAYSGAADIGGIHRFGLRAMIRDTYWWADPNGNVAQSSTDIQQQMETLAATLTTRLATYYNPLPLMESGEVELPLRPDIFVGCRFQYAPFRSDRSWQFYISAVSHRWVFGGPSTTTVELERGLPADILNDQNMMFDILTGNAMRKNGDFYFGLPQSLGPGLQVFGMANDSIKTVLGQIAKVYVTPGAT
jgi:hypothetical protein